MKSALIGYTGFVGGNIKQQASFNDYYNSENIEKIRERKYDMVVSAGTSSLMWKANLEPESDWKQIEKLINSLKKVKTNHFILISSIFVYPNPYNVNENTPIDKKNLKQPYGNHRYKLEEFVRKNFKKYTIIRLPNLFGRGLKKNFVFDLIHNNRLDLTHKDSKLQWYNIDYLWKDIQIALDHDLSLINFAVEPIPAWKIAKYTLNIKFDTITEKPPFNHDMLTKYASFYNSSQGEYIYYKDQILHELKELIKKGKKLL